MDGRRERQRHGNRGVETKAEREINATSKAENAKPTLKTQYKIHTDLAIALKRFLDQRLHS
jgi:hypothetical protein